jgi:integrator complex subunit 9
MELVNQNTKRNLKKDSGCAYLRQEKLHEVFAKEGIEEWQELYTVEEVEDCFNKHVTVVNYNEIHAHDSMLSLTAVSSGFHIGSSNWLVQVGTHKIGILRNSSEESEFRHPLALNTEPFQNLDVLIVGNIAKPIN